VQASTIAAGSAVNWSVKSGFEPFEPAAGAGQVPPPLLLVELPLLLLVELPPLLLVELPLLLLVELPLLLLVELPLLLLVELPLLLLVEPPPLLLVEPPPKCAVTLASPTTTTETGFALLVVAPLQPVNEAPVAGVAVSWTTAPFG
jgi:hypothetical protein